MKLQKQDRSPLIFASVMMVIGLSLVIGGIIGACQGSAKPQPEVLKVIETFQNERGLTSVIFTVNGKDTFGYDFLTPEEIDSIFCPVPVAYYNEGQILLPSYACNDTLIVMDSAGLNKGMALIEQGFIDGTDSDIDSILHRHNKQDLAYCMTFNEYQEHLKGEGYRADIALHLALVDFGRIAPNQLYKSIKED